MTATATRLRCNHYMSSEQVHSQLEKYGQVHCIACGQDFTADVFLFVPFPTSAPVVEPDTLPCGHPLSDAKDDGECATCSRVEAAEEAAEDIEQPEHMTRKECVAVLKAVGYTGPVSYPMPKLRNIVADQLRSARLVA